MSRTLFKIASAVVAMTAAQSAQATIVFSDNFDAYSLALNATGADLGGNWTVTGPGTVDLIGQGTPFNYGGTGKYIDLGGSNGQLGLLSTVQTFAAGFYTLTFDLAGSQRVPSNTTTVTLGDWSTTISLANTDPFQTFTFEFATTGGVLSFQDSGTPGNEGNLLDNVTLAVPEPATWALMIAGFAVVGAGLRRRSPVRVARFA